MLLVDDRCGEVGEADALLDESVRPDCYSGFARSDRSMCAFALRLPQRAREQNARNAELAADLLNREEVLLGERFGGGHERPLPPGLDGPQQGVKRDDRLSRAHISLEEALHRHGPREVGVDLADRMPLVLRQPERKHLEIAPNELAGRTESERHFRLVLSPAPREPDLQCEQLVESEPATALLGFLERARPVKRVQSVWLQREPASLPQLSREGIPIVAGARKCSGDELAQLPRRDLLARWVDGGEVGRRLDPVEVVGADVELSPAQLAAEADPRACPEPVGKPLLV